jgi:hypothetical protein
MGDRERPTYVRSVTTAPYSALMAGLATYLLPCLAMTLQQFCGRMLTVILYAHNSGKEDKNVQPR